MSTYTILLDDDVRKYGITPAAVMAKVRTLVQYRGVGEGYCQITCKLLMQFGICRDIKECVDVLDYLVGEDVLEMKVETTTDRRKVFVRFKSEAIKNNNYKLNEKDKVLAKALECDDSERSAALQAPSETVAATALPEKKEKAVIASNDAVAPCDAFELFYKNKKSQIADGFYTRVLHGAGEYIIKCGSNTHHFTRFTTEVINTAKQYGFDPAKPFCYPTK